MPPKISVIMPTFNTPEVVLKQAVESILCQTFSDFEFIIVDDGSTNESPQYLKTLRDSRIKLITNHENYGLPKSLNIALQNERGKYVARMDADDVSFPTRLERQFIFMDEHPDAIIVGTDIAFFGKGIIENPIRWTTPTDMDFYRIKALFHCPGPAHPTWLMNREKINRYCLRYDEKLRYAEDYLFLAQAAEYGAILTMDEKLLLYHVSDFQKTASLRAHPDNKVVREKLLVKLLDDLTDADSELHFRLSAFNDAKISTYAVNLYRRMIKTNNAKKIYPPSKFKSYIYDEMTRVLSRSFIGQMSQRQKLSLLFKYLPFPVALKETINVGRGKLAAIRRRRKQINLDLSGMKK